MEIEKVQSLSPLKSSTAGQQSSSPASAQGRRTSSLHQKAPPEPAGHGALQRHPGLSEPPTLGLGTGPTKRH